MDTITQLLAIFRDICAILLFLGNFSLFVLTIAKREMSNRGIVKAGCYFAIGIVGVLTNAKGIFPNRWPAVILICFTVGFWAFIQWTKRKTRGL